ncbi:Glycosyl phosphatidyl inositol protein transamidase complex subunit [Tulasnella sp. 403]|nr:Glycosyl phosphatidyl inositol protein transamidase complex subunit [Tulasnella sp. 403]
MSGPLGRMREKFGLDSNSKPVPEDQIFAQRLARRKVLLGWVARLLPYIRIILYVVGYIWMILIPFRHLGRGTWIDENALQPGQAASYWSWDDVHSADRYLDQVERLYATNATSAQKASFIQEEFWKLGLKAGVQAYHLTSHVTEVSGVNAYGVYAVPRASGAEAIVISASWVSRMDEGGGTPNMRGVATVLALAQYLSKYSLWAKDLIFVVNDGYMDGMHAWLSGYHSVTLSNLKADPLKHISGVIWTALCIDYPGHSFSHLGIFYEGLNGRLPNQDLLNSVVQITGYTGVVPTILYDNIESSLPISLLGPLGDDPEVKTYFHRASNVKRHWQYEGLNRASGVHGLFHKFRIDAITIFAYPALGPYGFHTLGQIVESTLRTMNNLLERLHASFFFYVLTSPRTFVNFGGYLASAILVSVAMIFGGLRLWALLKRKRSKIAGLVRSLKRFGDDEKGPFYLF